MKLLSNRFCVFFCTLLLCITLLPLDSAFARGRGGRGGGRGGGGASARTSSRTSLQNRGSFNSSRGTRQGSRSQTRQTNRGQAAQTRQGNQQSRQTNRDQAQQTRQGNQQTRQSNRDQAAQTRQGNQQSRQTNRDQAQQTRQGNQQERQSNRDQNQQTRQDAIRENQQNRQNTIQENQQNRQNFIDDNYDGDRWYGGGWYGGGYYAPPGWGAWTAAVGLAAGVAIGATVDSPPPYYSTVYVDDTSYIYSDGVYLEPQGSSYTVVAPPAGAVVTYLPDGCTSTQMSGNQYFDCSGVYYQMVYQNGTTVYQVVEL